MTGPVPPAADLPPWAGQRQVAYRFTLIDAATLRPIQQVTPLRDAPGTLTHDTNGSTYKRTLSLSFGRADSAVIDPRSHRIKIEMLLDGRWNPLGRYAFTAPERQRFTNGALLDSQLADEFTILDTEVERPVVPVGSDVGLTGLGGTPADDAIRALLAGLAVKLRIDPSAIELDNSWEAGTVVAKALHDMCALGGYLAPYFGHDTVLRVRRDFDPAAVPPDIDLDDTGRVIIDSVAESDDVLDSPNRIVVISNGTTATTAPLYGVYDVPPTAPNSAERIGFVKTRTYDVQLTSQTQADAVAERIGRQVTPLEYVELSTPPDPRHDSYNVIRWAGNNWLETRWSLPLVPGGAMRHTLRRAYGA